MFSIFHEMDFFYNPSCFFFHVKLSHCSTVGVLLNLLVTFYLLIRSFQFYPFCWNNPQKCIFVPDLSLKSLKWRLHDSSEIVINLELDLKTEFKSEETENETKTVVENTPAAAPSVAIKSEPVDVGMKANFHNGTMFWSQSGETDPSGAPQSLVKAERSCCSPGAAETFWLDMNDREPTESVAADGLKSQIKMETSEQDLPAKRQKLDLTDQTQRHLTCEAIEEARGHGCRNEEDLGSLNETQRPGLEKDQTATAEDEGSTDTTEVDQSSKTSSVADAADKGQVLDEDTRRTSRSVEDGTKAKENLSGTLSETFKDVFQMFNDQPLLNKDMEEAKGFTEQEVLTTLNSADGWTIPAGEDQEPETPGDQIFKRDFGPREDEMVYQVMESLEDEPTETQTDSETDEDGDTTPLRDERPTSRRRSKRRGEDQRPRRWDVVASEYMGVHLEKVSEEEYYPDDTTEELNRRRTAEETAERRSRGQTVRTTKTWQDDGEPSLDEVDEHRGSASPWSDTELQELPHPGNVELNV